MGLVLPMQVYEFDFILFKIPTELAKRTLKMKEGKEGEWGRRERRKRKKNWYLHYKWDVRHPHIRGSIGGLSTIWNSGKTRLRQGLATWEALYIKAHLLYTIYKRITNNIWNKKWLILSVNHKTKDWLFL